MERSRHKRDSEHLEKRCGVELHMCFMLEDMQEQMSHPQFVFTFSSPVILFFSLKHTYGES